MDNKKQWVPPDGGYGWIIAMVAFFLNALGTSGTGTFGVLYVEIIESFNISKSVASLYTTCLFTALSIGGAVCGPLIKIYGIRPVVIIGTIISWSGFFVSFFVQDYRVLFLTYGVTVGFGLCTLYVAGSILPQQYFDKKRGIAAGIASTGTGFSLLVWPLITLACSKAYGWQGAMLVCSAIMLHGLPCAALARPIPNTTLRDKTSSQSFLQQLRSAFDCSIFKNKLMVLSYTAGFIYCIGHVLPFLFIVPRAVYSGIDKEHAAYLASTLGLCTTIARPIVGWISDFKRINRITFMGICCCAAGICSTVSYFINIYPLLMTYCVFFGFCSGGFISLLFPVTVTLVGVEKMSFAIGFHTLFIGIATIISPIIGGVLSDQVDVHLPFLVAGIFKMLGGILMLGISILQKRGKNFNDVQTNIQMDTIVCDIKEDSTESDINGNDRPNPGKT